jgi:hypothetical protein
MRLVSPSTTQKQNSKTTTVKFWVSKIEKKSAHLKTMLIRLLILK